MRGWYDRTIKRLARMPLEIPPGYVPIRLVLDKGRIILLCPVNSVNKLPKSLKLAVQTTFLDCEPKGSRRGIVGPDGQLYAISPDNSPFSPQVTRKLAFG